MDWKLVRFSSCKVDTRNPGGAPRSSDMELAQAFMRQSDKVFKIGIDEAEKKRAYLPTSYTRAVRARKVSGAVGMTLRDLRQIIATEFTRIRFLFTSGSSIHAS
jgi:hypothetical protein